MPLSGGYDHLATFQQIIDYGEDALPALIDTTVPSMWRVQAIGTIASDIEKPIKCPEEIPENPSAVWAYIIIWATEHGYVTEEEQATEQSE